MSEHDFPLHDEAGPPPLVTFERADRVTMKPTEWLIDGWLVRDTLAGLVGPSGSCKSFLAVDWSCRIATGTLWYGRNVKRGAVFYLAGEGRTGLKKRITAWEQHTGVSIANAPLYLAAGLPFLCDDSGAEGIIDAVNALADEYELECGSEPALVVIDTVARAMSGANENSAEDMGAFVRSLDMIRQRWSCTVLTVHHTGHSAEAQERGRGSSAYRAALDSEMVIKPGDVDVTVRATKCKDWRTPNPLGLTKVEVKVMVPNDDGLEVPETSLVLHDCPGAMTEQARKAEVLDLHREQLSERAIEKQTGIPRATVGRWIREAKKAA